MKLKEYNIDNVKATYYKVRGVYIVNFFFRGQALQHVKDPSKYWDLKYKTVKEIKKTADKLSCL